MRCPFCATEDQEALIYWYAEGERGIRVDHCLRCQQRIKTINTHYPEGIIVPVLDDLVTSHLDMAISMHERQK